MNTVPQVSIVAKPDEEIVITTRSRSNVQVSPFSPVAVEGETLVQINGEPRTLKTRCVFKVLQYYKDEGSPSVAFFLLALLNARDTRTNVAVLVPKTKAEENGYSNAYKVLVRDKVVKRIKPRTYLIDPLLVYPYFGSLGSVLDHWCKVIGEAE